MIGTAVFDRFHAISVLYVGPVICVLVMLAGAFGFGWGCVHVYVVRTTYIRAVGHIDGIGSSSNGQNVLYRPTVAFVDRDGVQHRMHMPSRSSNRSNWTVGAAVTVAYPPDRPSKAEPLSLGWNLFMIGIPLGMMVGSAGMLWLFLTFGRSQIKTKGS